MFKVLEFDDFGLLGDCELFEYMSVIYNPEYYDMSWFIKQAGCIFIGSLDEDLNIDCITNEIKIYSKCISKIDNWNLGTKKFFDSIKTLTIDYWFLESEINVDEDINLLQKYFKNLKCINLEHIKTLSLGEISKIITKHKIDNINSKGSKNDEYDFSIISETGCILFYDCEDKYCLSFTKIEIQADSEYCVYQGEFVILFYDYVGWLKLDFAGVTKNSVDYNLINLSSIEQQAIIMHKKYIHTLSISKNLKKTLDFVPTKKLELTISSEYQGETIDYFHKMFFNKIHTFVSFE